MLDPYPKPVVPLPAATPETGGDETRDLDLAARIRAGDHAAFKTLFDRYYDSLCTFAERYVGVAEGEEIVERLFVALWAKREHWVVRQGLRDYLFGAVRNEVRNHRRHTKIVARWAELRDPLDQVPGLGRPPGSADEQLYASELEAALWRAIAGLPARRREALTLRFRHSRSYAEIAAELHLSQKTVETHISRALKTLRTALTAYM